MPRPRSSPDSLALRVTITVSPSDLAAIDAARGSVSRSEWLRVQALAAPELRARLAAAEARALHPLAVAVLASVDPEVLADWNEAGRPLTVADSPLGAARGRA